MPTYIDCHALAAIPSAIQRQMPREALRGILDQHGVQPLAHWVTDGVIYCVVQAPDKEASCQHHAERGLACDELRPITGLRGSRPLSGEETKRVRTIINFWPTDGAAAWGRGRQPVLLMTVGGRVPRPRLSVAVRPTATRAKDRVRSSGRSAAPPDDRPAPGPPRSGCRPGRRRRYASLCARPTSGRPPAATAPPRAAVPGW